MEGFSVFGVTFERLDTRRAAKKLMRIIDSESGARVFTPNLHMLRAASRDKEIAQLLSRADILLPDGIGVSLACRLRGICGVSRITGIDTAFFVMRYAAAKGASVFLLGANEGIADLASKRLGRKIPNLKICGTHHGYFDKAPDSAKNRAVLAKIRRASPDILFVCFGFPEQERWILQSSASLPSVKLFMGLGGSFDVWSGKVRRAPFVLRALDLEWLWRCVLEPRRFKRLL